MSTVTRLTPTAFREAVTGLQDQLRRKIEAEVDGFPADDAARRQRIAKVRDPVTGYRFFVETYFPHYIKSAPNLLHLHLFERFPQILADSKPGRRGARLVEMAPRGSAKSTMLTQIGTLYAAITGQKKFIIIGMDAYEQAALMLEAIKVELEDNPRLQMDFPECCGEGRTWREGEMVTRNGVRFQAVGSRQKVRGRRHGPHRPDLVILDDIENDENVRSPEFRSKLESWVLKAVEPLGPADGSLDLIIVGTLLHYDAVLRRLGNRAGWELHTWRAIMTFPEDMAAWDAFTEIALNDGEDVAKAFYETNRAAMDAGAVLFWPAVKSLVSLMYKRATSEDSFLSEDQNDPVADGSPFKNIIFWAQKLQNWMFFGAVDPSLGKHGKSRDPSAILVGGFDRSTGVLDVVEASIRKRLPDVICEDVIAMQREWNCVLWGVESVQFQEFLRTEIMVRAAKQGVPLPAMPIMPIADKHLRIERLQPQLASGLIRLHISQTTLREQLQQWPNAAHDDGPDCLEMLWSLAITHGAGGLRPDAILGGRNAAPARTIMQGYRL
ncbi:phage terminase large subunit [Camelimonas lactis]|uniref:Putative phage terminase large subunit-like protein n=1 Tax=Camelimonas lactis TaxID=659006 RepID=A0A4R2GWM5_9HYPH|nr:phage terminase large subunit [Camelimonas lactis]TCO15194.1 putative phage terminase large subunit-like protein [Camelimonas lactis]